MQTYPFVSLQGFATHSPMPMEGLLWISTHLFCERNKVQGKKWLMVQIERRHIVTILYKGKHSIAREGLSVGVVTWDDCILLTENTAGCSHCLVSILCSLSQCHLYSFLFLTTIPMLIPCSLVCIFPLQALHIVDSFLCTAKVLMLPVPRSGHSNSKYSCPDRKKKQLQKEFLIIKIIIAFLFSPSTSHIVLLRQRWSPRDLGSFSNRCSILKYN